MKKLSISIILFFVLINFSNAYVAPIDYSSHGVQYDRAYTTVYYYTMSNGMTNANYYYVHSWGTDCVCPGSSCGASNESVILQIS